MTNYHHSPWLSFYQPSTKVNSNPRMCRYCRKLSLNHCSSDQSERNKSCIPDPATICTLLNEYIHKRLLNTSVFVKETKTNFSSRNCENFFRTLTQKTNAAKSNQRKNGKEKGHDIHGNYTKREDFNILILKGYNLSVLFIEFLNSIWRWSNNVPQ